jgi:hypothetical protein
VEPAAALIAQGEEERLEAIHIVVPERSNDNAVLLLA